MCEPGENKVERYEMCQRMGLRKWGIILYRLHCKKKATEKLFLGLAKYHVIKMYPLLS